MEEELDIFDPMYKFQIEKEPLIEYPKPYIDLKGREPTLVIQHNSDPKYHWWAKGQSIYQTLVELKADEKVITAYCGSNRTYWY